MRDAKTTKKTVVKPIKPEEVTELDLEKTDIFSPVKKEEKEKPKGISIGTLNVYMAPGKAAALQEEPQKLAAPMLVSKTSLLFKLLLLFAGLGGLFALMFFGIPFVKYYLAGNSLTVDLSFPTEVKNYEPFEAAIVLKNTSNKVLDNIFVSPQFPKTFELISSQPSLEDGKWKISGLSSRQEQNISFTGKIIGSQEEHLFVLQASKNGDKLGHFQKQISTYAPPVLIEQLINGSKEAIVNLGDSLNIRLNLKNQGAEELKDASLQFELDGPLFDLKTLSMPQGRIAGQKILIDSSNLPLLKSLAPGAEANLLIRTKVLSHVPDSFRVLADPPLLKSKLTLSYKKGNKELILVDEAKIKVNSDIALLSQARYFSLEGEQIGRGPLPPEVGSKTTYWILLRIGNILNAMENVVLTLRLAPETEWTGRGSTSEGSEFLFNNFSREVVWVLGDIPANRSFTLEPPSGSFELAVVPSAKTKGAIPLLIKEIILSAKDSFTGATIEKNFPPIDADLRFDERGRLMGIRVK